MGNVPVGSIAGIPISLSPWFGLLVLVIIWTNGLTVGAVWILSLVVSLLAHEMGHGLAAKRLRLNPEIVLHAFGGYCTHSGASTDRDDVKILLAGPALGLVFGLAALALYLAFPAIKTIPLLAVFFRGMLLFGIFWNLANLLPIWPLDGGQLARLLALRLMKPIPAERLVHGAALVLLLLSYQAYIRLPFGGRSGLLIILFLGIAWFNVRVLAGWASAGRIRTHNRYAVELMKNANDAYAAADYREAARLCHQIRSESNVPPSILTKVWKLLGLATYQTGNKQEAAAYLQRADLDAEVAVALVDSWCASGDVDALQRLLSSKAFGRLPASTRDPLITRARDL